MFTLLFAVFLIVICSWLVSMDAEDQLGGSVDGDQNEAIDRFPEGMRVLAVDDNPICLKNLEFTLRQCHYEGLFLVLLLFYYT